MKRLHIHPAVEQQIAKLDYSTAELRGKNWNEFTRPEAPLMVFIITMRDNVAGEDWPVWPGHPLSALWNPADPAAVHGSDEAKRQDFTETFQQTPPRARTPASLPLDKLDAPETKRELDIIGRLQEGKG